MVLIGILIGAAFFVALFALVAGSYSDRTSVAASQHDSGHAIGTETSEECLLCHGRLPRLGTADDAVTEIERRIAGDRHELAAALGGGSDGWPERR